MDGDWITGQIDDVPTFLRPKEGPTTLGLTFRVGVADETIPTRGITHLVEHLALHKVFDADAHSNGFTTLDTTSFVVRGRPDEVKTFVDDLCASLRDLPRERFDVERRILEAEERERATGGLDNHLRLRYGNQAWGLAGHAEHGLRTITSHQVQGWADHWFTRDNCVLWAVGTLPEDLMVFLGRGDRHPAPPVTATVRGRRFVRGDRLALLSMEVPSGSVAAVAARVLGDRCFRRLRLEEGSVYSVHPSVTDLDGDRSLLSLGVETDPKQADAIVRGLLNELGVITVAGPGRDEVDKAKRAFRRGLDEPDAVDGSVRSAALDVLVGRRPRTIAERAADLDAVTVDDVRRLFEIASADAHLTLPEGAGQHDLRYGHLAPVIPAATSGAVRTTVLDQVDRGDRLLVDGEGVHRFYAETSQVQSVRWNAAAGLLRFGDGGRLVLGLDHQFIQVHPAEWVDGPQLVAAIDRSVPPDRVVDDPEPLGSAYLEAAQQAR